MLNNSLLCYSINEFQKNLKYPQLRILWFLAFLIPIGFAFLLSKVNSLNFLSGIDNLRTKLSFFFWGIELVFLPICTLTFFVSLQLEYRFQTFLWPVIKTADDSLWVWGKFIVLYLIYLVIALLSFSLCLIIFQYSNVFKDIPSIIVIKWFKELSLHFILMPISAFITMFFIGLLQHRYIVALIVVIALTYAFMQNDTFFAPFFALRYNLNLNMLLLSGTPSWQYSDLAKNYYIAVGYSILLIITIQYLVRRFGLYRLFNL